MKLPILGFVGQDENFSYTVNRQQLEQMTTDFFKVPNSVQSTCKSVITRDNMYRALPINCFSSFHLQWLNTLNFLNYTKDWFDCLLPGTPLVCRNTITGTVEILEVQEVTPLDTEVLDFSEPDGFRWTRVNWVASKRTRKDAITVKTPQGFIQTTEDHKFYWHERWNRIGEIEKLGWKAELTSPPVWDVFKDNYELDPDLAKVYGLFMAEGHAHVSKTSTTNHSYSWHIDVCNEERLIEAKEILEQHYPIKFKVYLPDSQKAGKVAGGVVRKNDLFKIIPEGPYGSCRPIALQFSKKFYTSTGKKKVPLEVLNSTRKAKQAFIEEFVKNDGSKYKNIWLVAQKSRVAVLGLLILARKIGWSYVLSYDRRKDCPIISFHVDGVWGKEPWKQGGHGCHVAKPYVRTTAKAPYVVYDLNTQTHSFVASTFLVHNCEDFSMLFKSLLSSCNYNSAGLVEGDLYYQGQYVGRHMWNIILFCNPSWPDPLQSFRLFEYEPQIGAILINHQSFDGFTYVGDEVEW